MEINTNPLRIEKIKPNGKEYEVKDNSTESNDITTKIHNKNIVKLIDEKQRLTKIPSKETPVMIPIRKYLIKSPDTEFTRSSVRRERYSCYNYFFLSLCVSFMFGLALGVFLMGPTHKVNARNTTLVPRKVESSNTLREGIARSLSSIKEVEYQSRNEIDMKSKKAKHAVIDKFLSVSFTGENESHKYKKDIYPKGMTEDMKDILKDNKSHLRKHRIPTTLSVANTYVPNDDTVLFNNIYWGLKIEKALPKGYDDEATEVWEKYIEQAEIVKMETGCGRMQNRLVTFSDGLQACVRYRQNTDQIQGEIFSFYVAKMLNLTNLAPSVVKIVDLKDKLWKNVANDIASAQWNTNRAVVLTQYIPSLESANIPEIFKPTSRHLNKFDILKLSMQENDTVAKTSVFLDKLKAKDKKVGKDRVVDVFDHIDMRLNKKTVDSFVELAQWSDLIIFDYLTANLDRIVNNLFNFQWNVNIMDGPAHNLARKVDNGLLMFLDNESGLLHGYRLLKKYNVYHSVMLDNLCVFRQSTVDSLKGLYDNKNVGAKLSEVFHKKNDVVIRDILPPLPEKNAKILHDRIGKVVAQVEKCEQSFSNR